jgi:hypothetical protein
LTTTGFNEVIASVSEGCFPDGIQPMLWSPSADRARLRWLAVSASVLSAPTLFVPAGVGVLVLATGSDTAAMTGLLAIAGIAALLLGVGHLVVSARCFREDHTHGPDRPCRLDRRCGEFYYRPADFADLPTPVAYAARGIIEAVGYLHGSPAAAWLARGHLHEIHQVAWNTLRSLDDTRTARHLVEDASHDADLATLAHTVQDALSTIDHGVLDVLTYLLHSVELTHAWANKLHHATARARLHTVLDTLQAASIERTVHAAEALPQTTFAYVTAARDVLAAGSFAWEQPPTTPAQRVPDARVVPVSGLIGNNHVA